MNLGKAPQVRTALALGIAATTALVIIGPGSTAAFAGRMIGSAAIHNNSIRSLDIRNDTIRSRDVKDGSLRARDFAGTMGGATGPTGKAGRAGATGDDGAPGSHGPTGPPGAPGVAGADGATGPRGPAGTDGSNGADGSSSPAGLGSFLYTYNSDPQTVPVEADVIFDSPGTTSDGFTHFPGTSTIEVLETGDYEVAFTVTAAQPNQFTLFDNGAPMSGTTYGSASGSQQNTGRAIVRILAGDTITLRNHTSISAVTLDASAGGVINGTNASLTIERLTP